MLGLPYSKIQKKKKREYGLLGELIKTHILSLEEDLATCIATSQSSPSHIIQSKSIYKGFELTEFRIQEKSKIKCRVGPSKLVIQVLLTEYNAKR